MKILKIYCIGPFKTQESDQDQYSPLTISNIQHQEKRLGEFMK